jgi:hypothetical protein
MAQFRTDLNKIDSGQVFTRYEVYMSSDRLSPSGTLTDAFGRLRVSEPLTLFDSQHRYIQNEKWATANNGTSNVVYHLSESAVDMDVGTANNDYVYRETKKVFAYQPGKSLLIMNTFAMNEPKANLVQRVGYFGVDNGIYLENDGTTNYLVLRSNSSGTITETKVSQSSWNIDKFDGTGYAAQSGRTEHSAGLDTTKTNIFWTDIEWLGVGDVRCGFVVDGRMLTAHIFHNDNINTTAYMTTACLPIRYEIVNTGTTTSNSTLKQICSTVISEGGYTLAGKQRSAGGILTSPKDIPTAGTFVPIISIRLKSDKLDAIVIPTSATFFGVTNNTQYKYKIVVGGTLSNAVFNSAATSSSVEWDTAATAINGGDDVTIGYVNVGAGSGAAGESFEQGLFKFQLERNSFTGTPTIFSLVATGAANGNDALGAIDWEEIFQ